MSMNDGSRRASQITSLRAVDASETALTSFPEPRPSSPSLSTFSGNHDTLDTLLDQAGQPSMFDDRPGDSVTADPQALSASPACIIESTLTSVGHVELVRRLAAALAERDAHVTALLRLCEEYNVPRERITEASSRIKQSEQRRIQLAMAVKENNQTLRVVMSENDLRPQALHRSNSAYSTSSKGGLTKLFGGGGRNRLSVHSESASLRSSSRASRPTDGLRREHSNDARSVDDRSLDNKSVDSGRWLPAMFTSAATAVRPRRDSKPSRVPVELQAQIDPDQLPPTLLKNPTDPQDIEWNRFILKLMRAREQAGEQEEEGQLIGAATFGREGALGRAKMETLAKLVINGVPNRLRHRVWMELSNAHAISQPDAYQHYLQLGNAQNHIDIDAIKKDVPRTLTQQYSYYVEKGYEKLKNVLIAFIAKYEDLGYTQGLNMIAGHLLLAIPAEEDAFWMLCNIIDNFYPSEYFSRSSNLVGPLADNMVLRMYVKEVMPKLHEHLEAIGILPQNTLKLGWILTAFSDVLPRDSLQRVWDVWLCLPRQHTFLFNVAVALIKQHADGLLALEDEEQYYAFQYKIPETTHEVDELVRLAFAFRKKLDPDQVMERRKAEMRRLRNPSTEALYSSD